ncbi:GNAT family N-acetyltransferase [Methylobacter sp.]|uniref:GNAT family N-acetyltransferase n=1 Tax=Methylobacter sp. TaxID=2051955 RepID=UPI001208DB3A|nr:GNAT family N-acetyltransferase [Methylobacter sp.]TAK65183.1 MAG: GNAT family N-acetyltransferase [Methylobacter sp.]
MTNWKLLPASTFSEHTERWDNLNQQLYRSHPMLDSRFVAALLKHFGNQQTLLAVFPSNEEHGGNFLILRPKKLGIWDTFLPSQAQIAPLLCAYPQSIPRLFTSLPGLPVVAIDLLCQDPLNTFSTQALPHIETFAHANTMNIDLAETFDDYWHQRSKNLRHNINRYFNRLNKNGINYQLKVFSKPDDLQHALHRYGDLETESWKGKTGTSIHSQNEQGQFYGDVLSAFSSTGQAEIVELYLNDQLAASRINILNKDMLIILKTTYDENLSNYAPGRLLLYLLIEREFSLKRVQHIEFYTNATVDQLSWSMAQRNIEHLTVYRSENIQWAFKTLRNIKTKLT